MGNFKTGSGADSGAPALPTPEEVSQLVDGELDAARVETTIAGLCRRDGATDWVCYHVIGEVIRGAAPRGRLDWPAFGARLDAEPTVLAPSRRAPAPHAIGLAIAATVAAVSVVGWVALTTMPVSSAMISSARQASQVRATDARPTVDSEYVLVHREYSPTNVIQGMRPFMRAVAASEPDARP